MADITLSNATVTNVVTALAEALTTAKNSGTALMTFCTAATKAKFPATPIEKDVVAVVDKLAEKLGWNGTAREKVSKSEARNIVRQHALLPELMTALRASAYGACSYHDAVKLCRLIAKHETVPATIEAFNTPTVSKPQDVYKTFKAALAKFEQCVLEEKKGKDKTAKLEAIAAFEKAMGFVTEPQH